MNRTFIIAEAGVNHNGDLSNAKRLIDIATSAGADAVKFQFFKADNLVTDNAKKAEYQMEFQANDDSQANDNNQAKNNNQANDDSQLNMLKKLELSFEQHIELKDYCKDKNIIFLSSPFDQEGVKIINKLDIPIIKIPSGEIENVPYLREAGGSNKPVILSTGMSNLSEIEFAINILKEEGCNDISLLHCNTEYPTPYDDVNLKAMLTIKEAFKLPVGFSDHTQGIEISIAAAAMGAAIIEKHFTIDKNMEGPDHKASLSPDELRDMIKSIRNIESAMGSGIKRLSKSELKNMPIVRKSIVAKTEIKQGDIFTEENVIPKRPQGGISPKEWDLVIGKPAKRAFKKDEIIEI